MANIFQRAVSAVSRLTGGLGANISQAVSRKTPKGAFIAPVGQGLTEKQTIAAEKVLGIQPPPQGAPFIQAGLPLSAQPAFNQPLTRNQPTVGTTQREQNLQNLPRDIQTFIATGGAGPTFPSPTSLPGNIRIIRAAPLKPSARAGEEGSTVPLGGGGATAFNIPQAISGATGGAQLLPGAIAPLFRTGGTGIPVSPEEEEKQRSEKLGGPSVSTFPGTTPDLAKLGIAQEFAKSQAASGLKEIQVAPKALRFIPQTGQEFIVDVPETLTLESFQKAVPKAQLKKPITTADTISGFQQLITTAVQNEKQRLDQINPPAVVSLIDDPDVNSKVQQTGDQGLLQRYTQIQDTLGITSMISQIKDLTNSQLAIKNAIVTARDDILEDPDFPKELKARRVEFLLKSSKEAREFEAITDRIDALTSNLKLLNDEAKTRIGLVETDFKSTQAIAKETRETKREDEKAIRELQIKYPEAAIGPTDSIGTATQKASQAEQIKSKGKFEIREADGSLVKVFTNDPSRQAEVVFRGKRKKGEIDPLDEPLNVLDLQRLRELFPLIPLTVGMTQRQAQEALVTATTPREYSLDEIRSFVDEAKGQGLTKDEVIQNLNTNTLIKNKDDFKSVIDEKFQRKGFFGVGGKKTKPPKESGKGGPQAESFDPFRSRSDEDALGPLVSFPSTFRF